jgi:hypothetical protein
MRVLLCVLRFILDEHAFCRPLSRRALASSLGRDTGSSTTKARCASTKFVSATLQQLVRESGHDVVVTEETRLRVRSRRA